MDFYNLKSTHSFDNQYNGNLLLWIFSKFIMENQNLK
jgi:hypothetical protein